MRAETALELKVGLLVICGLVAAIVTVLIFDGVHFEHYYQLRAFLPDAGGLHRHSPVTLVGIRIGEVEDLATTNDPRGNVVVRLKIEQQYRLPTDTKLSLASSGIFADTYLAFTGVLDTKSPLLPLDGSGVVIAKPGFFDTASKQAQKILEGASDLLGPDNRQQVKRLITGAADLAEVTARLASNIEKQSSAIDATLASAKEITSALHVQLDDLHGKATTVLSDLDRTLKNLDDRSRVLTDAATATAGHLDTVLVRGSALLADNGQLATAVSSMRDLMQRIASIADGLEHGQGVLGQLLRSRDLARDLNLTAIDLSRTASYIADHPQALVFGMSEKETAAQHAFREREKERRAFNSNYGGIPLVVQAPPPQSAAPTHQDPPAPPAPAPGH